VCSSDLWSEANYWTIVDLGSRNGVLVNNTRISAPTKLDDGEILTCLEAARELGAMAMIHAENADAIAYLTKRLTEQGKTAPRFHGMSRPMPVEREATHRAITLSELVDVPILVVHVSGAEAVEQIRWARGRGLNIFAETCPQYLFLTQEHLGLDGFHGAKCVCSPPPRDARNQQVIWDGLADGLFTIVSSDHAPFRYDDPQGKKLGGEEPSFEYIPNGIPGIETRLPLLFSEGVLAGRLTIQQFVALTSTNPAKLYGLYPRKGTIAIGADADLVIWDTSKRQPIRNEMLHHEVDYTPYEGIEVSAWPGMTLSRGRVVWDGTNFLGEAGGGEFLPCGKPDAAKPRLDERKGAEGDKAQRARDEDPRSCRLALHGFQRRAVIILMIIHSARQRH
jgi:dihydropyrimidinase